MNAGCGCSMPPLRRGPMVARPWRGFFAGLLDLLAGRAEPPAQRGAMQPWQRAAARRRAVLTAIVVGSAVAATALLLHTLPEGGPAALRIAQVLLFALLFAWVAAGFATAMMGAWVLWRGDPHALTARGAGHAPLSVDARTAIVMPICNENVAAVFGGLRASCESLAATGVASLFDVYVLSDTNDPGLRAAELAAWAELRDALGEGARVHYRWRTRRTRRKSGNVADFCRRWGRNYRYMVVLDADSVMSGDALVAMVRLMEAHPDAGIVQSAPRACGVSTLHARAQQFAGRVTGRLFSAGMRWWQLGESHYWGHNAIIRVEPFMKHCALALLPGRGGLSGEILSHDFVEAALMRRAGWHVWLVDDIEGSYEQQPANLLDELQRDRRWCQGNLQNARLVTEPGLHGVHRAMLLTGAMAYLSAPLWLAFLLFGSALWLTGGAAVAGVPGSVPPGAAALWLATLAMLALPRVAGVAALLLTGAERQYGGRAALLRGALVEAALSVLSAPVRMVAHSLFVLGALTGLKLEWKSPPREASDIAWGEALRRFGPLSVFALALLASLALIEPRAALWLAPVVLPIALAVPFVVWTSRASLGCRALAHRLLMTPEEHCAPRVLRQAWQFARRAAPAPGWLDTLTDPWLFEVVRQAPGARDTAWGSRGRARRLLVAGLVERDTVRLGRADRLRLLAEPQSMVALRDQLAASRKSLTTNPVAAHPAFA
ncbi:glucans biosynthesis glucosyltransferase MdoH [Piscinibacter sp.]|uniref:glucans biosynthesis glucosyltransferase MdoH n=1 Tax=Piscinibacter sp. TaxID=1903157 RepID=UPI0039E43A39